MVTILDPIWKHFEGVVSASGFSYGKGREEEHYSCLIELIAWRVDGGPLQTGELGVFQSPGQGGLAGLSAVVSPYSVVKFRARWAKNVYGMERYLADTFEKIVPDAEMAAVIERDRAPVEFLDAQLGKLRLDHSRNEFIGEVDWCGFRVEVGVQANTIDEANARAGALRQLLAETGKWDQSARLRLEGEFLPEWNEVWRPEGEALMDADGFQACIEPQSLSVDAEGELSLCYDGGESFGGHWLEVRGTLRDGWTSTGMIG